MMRPAKIAASMMATLSLKWCGTSDRTSRETAATKIKRKKASQPSSVATEERDRTLDGTRRGLAVPPSLSPMEEEPTVVASRRIFEGRVFNVRADDVRWPDGAEHRIEVVEHGASLAIVATPSPNELILVRQYRHPAGSALWEIPAGSAEPYETPVEGALRELREETGYTAGRITPILSVWTTPGFCSELMHFFHADHLVAGEPAFAEDERIEIGCFSIEAAWRLVAEKTADAKTALALFWLQGGEDKIGSALGR